MHPDCIGQLVALLDSDPAAGAAIPKILYYSEPDREPAVRINSYGVLINFTWIACPNFIDEPDRRDLPL